MIKDFETALNFKWSSPRSFQPGMTSGNCTSGECFGLFQVDVRLERNPVWQSELCGSDYLNISQYKGGMDYCTFLF